MSSHRSAGEPVYVWFRRHARLIDRLGTILLIVLVTLPYLFAPSAAEALGSVLLSLALTVPLLWRRSRPAAVTFFVAAVCLIQWAILDASLVLAQVSVLIIIYSMAARAPRWVSFSALGLGALGSLLAAQRYSSPGGADDAAARFVQWALVLLLTVGSTWLLGDMARVRRLREEELQERARRLEQERKQERQLAAADERSRIAREMHDIVAHSLSVMIAQADGARYAAAQQPEVAAQALGTIAATGRQSLQEMRRLLGVLRGPDGDSIRPVPGLADLGDLINTVRTAGLSVQWEQRGSVRHDALPQGAELALYRVVQESLTNVMKHAGVSASAHVLVHGTGRGVEVTVTDDGLGAAAAGPHGAGQGVLGMRERVELYEGALSAGPRLGGGFVVFATIPYSAP